MKKSIISLVLINIVAFGFTSFNQDISKWNTSKATTMESMFEGNLSFNQNIGSWDISSVISTEKMFYNSAKFNQDISGWDTSKIANANSMFENATLFNQNISGWNTSSLSSADKMFLSAPDFNQDLTNWNVSNVATQPLNFAGKDEGPYGGDSFAYFFPKHPNWGTNGVKKTFFYDVNIISNQSGIKTVECDDAIPGSINFYEDERFGMRLFYIATDKNDAKNAMIRFGGAFDPSSICTSHITDMSYMFAGSDFYANNIILGDELFTWDTKNVTDMKYMFAGSGFSQPIKYWNTSNVIDMTHMFAGYTGGYYDLRTDKFNENLSLWDVSNVIYMEGMFLSQDIFNKDISSWCVENIEYAPLNFSNDTIMGPEQQPKWGQACSL